jgi:hypothetical protein
VPILPLIDLMILLGTVNLGLSAVIKLITVTTHYQPFPLGLGPADFVVIALVCFVFALTLAARTWVKLNESRMVLARRDMATAQARLHLAGMGEVRGDADSAHQSHESSAADGH